MSDLASLIERLENLEGPSPEVDEAIQAWSVGATAEWQDYAKRNAYRDGFWVSIGPVQPFTASLDAVIALVEQKLPDACYRAHKLPPSGVAAMGNKAWATCGLPGEQEQGVAVTPAIALCIAFLKALPPSPDNKGDAAE